MTTLLAQTTYKGGTLASGAHLIASARQRVSAYSLFFAITTFHDTSRLIYTCINRRLCLAGQDNCY
ncbi:hypothetical protein D9756_006240 [Leucocoprinus leucothites]|uniref:Uncharacterized protein n=1 Tax=Leucocoprinus leucothites TaxID=201217 RepID=A0A8H5D4W2_9AGAR|nr:hypothetical protein D9756_006240 [Leucoagaricus leucothites]